MTPETEVELPPPANDAEEIQRLRKTKESLHNTAQTRKARIEELEAELATLKLSLESANKKIYEQTVGIPLKAMSKDISVIPSLFEREFSTRFGLVETDGILYVTKAGDATPLKDGDQPVAFTASALNKVLADNEFVNAEDADLFKRLLIGSRASGGGATVSKRGGQYTPQPAKPSAPKPLQDSFGLK